MADIKIKHLVSLDGKEMEVGHLYQALCKTMARYEGPRAAEDACCGPCAEELLAEANELKAENETYKALFFPVEAEDAPKD